MRITVAREGPGIGDGSRPFFFFRSSDRPVADNIPVSMPQDANPLPQDAPLADPASHHDGAPAVEPVAAEEAVSFDDTPLPETALPTEAVAFTESPVPTIESPVPAGDVTLALTPFEHEEADASALTDVGPAVPAVTDAVPADDRLTPWSETSEEGQDEGSAAAAIEDHAALPVEETTEALVNEPAPADMEAIAATLQLDVQSSTLDVQRSEEEEGERPTLNVERPTSNEDHTPTLTAPRKVLSGGWTMGFLLSGIAIIAACILIPQGDETRKLMYERAKLRADLEQVQKQVATNGEFLQKVQSDPTLAQRLAQRQMKLVPAGTKVLDVDDASPTKDDKSPFLIVSVPPPAPMPPYQPRGGVFAQMCRNGRSQLYMIGGGLLLLAAGLVLGASGPRD